MPTTRTRLVALAPRALIRSFAQWPVGSQHRARRNALVACTELTARRKEREDVEDFLASRYRTSVHGVRRSG